MENSLKVYTTSESVKANKKWFQTWRIIYPVFGIVVAVELILGAKTLLAPLPKPTKVNLQPIGGAYINMFSDKTVVKPGDTISVKIKVSTSGNLTSGTDLVLRFDPKVLTTSQTAFIPSSPL